MRERTFLRIPFLLLVAATLLLVNCKGSPEASRAEEYLVRCEPLVNEAGEMAGRVADLFNNADKYELADIEAALREAEQQYEDLIDTFTALETPQECVALRGYTTDGLDNMRQAIHHLAAAFGERDVEYLYDAQDSYDRAIRSMALAANEWDRLHDFVSQEGGIDIVQILLGLLGLGIAVSIAMFVLQLALGTSFGILAGAGAAIGFVWDKITGRRRS